ncbi:MAG TPA: hypothetical protein VG841_11340 [Caulobacterales bacterium]|nr:hypothetical protein [Caulobacterales bacterium]
MADQQPLRATFFTFRRRERGLLLPAAITFAVLMILSFIALTVLVSLAMGVSPAAMFNPRESQGVALEMANAPQRILNVLGIEFLFLVVFFILCAAFEAGCLRWMIRGERGGLFGIALNADTWRVYGTYWLWAIFAFIADLFIALIGVMLGFVANQIGASTPGFEWVWMLLVALIVLCLPVILIVRTAPAAAVSVGTKRFAFFDSWKVTKGRFWAMFGSFLLLIILQIVLTLALWGAMFGTVFAGMLQAIVAGWSNPQQMSQGMEAAMANIYASPAVFALYVGLQIAGVVMGVIFHLLFFGVNARAVIAAAEDGKIQGLVTVETAKTFE